MVTNCYPSIVELIEAILWNLTTLFSSTGPRDKRTDGFLFGVWFTAFCRLAFSWWSRRANGSRAIYIRHSITWRDKGRHLSQRTDKGSGLFFFGTPFANFVNELFLTFLLLMNLKQEYRLILRLLFFYFRLLRKGNV